MLAAWSDISFQVHQVFKSKKLKKLEEEESLPIGLTGAADILKKSDNLQYNTLGRWVTRLIDQASDGPSIILID